MRTPLLAALVGAALVLPAASLAHGDHHGSRAGHPGAAARVTRTVEVTMNDAMRFRPAHVEVARGQTVRFQVTNAGKVAHEFVIGTQADIEAHAAMMRRMPGMKHTDGDALSLAPGARGSLVWTFAGPGVVPFACLEPGHYEAGMRGAIRVK